MKVNLIIERLVAIVAAGIYLHTGQKLPFEIVRNYSSEAIHALKSGSDVRTLGAAASLLAECLSPRHVRVGNIIFTLTKLSEEDCILALRKLLCFPGFCKDGKGSAIGAAQSLEGTGFGIRVEGLLDGAAILLRRGSDVCYFLPENTELQDACQVFLSAWVGKRIWSPLCRQIANGGGGELSPSGVCSAVCAIIA